MSWWSWSLRDIVIDMCVRAGIPRHRINADELWDRVQGMDHSPEDPIYKSLEQLGQIFLFDPVSHSGMLNFVKRGKDPVASITSDDLVVTGTSKKSSERKDSITVPRILHLLYHDTEGALDPHIQTSDRSIDSRSVAEAKIETSITMETGEAARAVIINHKVMAEDQSGEIDISLTDEWIGLTDGDVVLLDGVRMRIVETEIDFGIQKYKLKPDRRSAYSSEAVGVRPPSIPDPPSLVVGKTIMHFIDSHILRDSDDRIGYYVAVSRLSGSNWPGALIELSLDGGSTFVEFSDVQIEATVGEIISELPEFSRFVPDDINEVTVRLIQPEEELESTSFRGMLNRANLAIIGNELINFEIAEQLTEDTWRLSGFLRGRKGSPISNHLPGERFIIMDRALLPFIGAELFYLRKELTFKVTTFDSDEPTETVATFTGVSQTERPVANLSAVRKGGDIEITWVGVGRIGGGSTTRHGSGFSGYLIKVNGTTHNSLRSELTVPDPGGVVIITVQQVNSLTGPGPAQEISI